MIRSRIYGSLTKQNDTFAARSVPVINAFTMISFQDMDNSHVSLVNWELLESPFEGYSCDEDPCLGIPFGSLKLNKILKCWHHMIQYQLKHTITVIL